MQVADHPDGVVLVVEQPQALLPLEQGARLQAAAVEIQALRAGHSLRGGARDDRGIATAVGRESPPTAAAAAARVVICRCCCCASTGARSVRAGSAARGRGA